MRHTHTGDLDRARSDRSPDPPDCGAGAERGTQLGHTAELRPFQRLRFNDLELDIEITSLKCVRDEIWL